MKPESKSRYNRGLLIYYRATVVVAACGCVFAFAALAAGEPKDKAAPASALMPAQAVQGFRPNSPSVDSRSALEDSHTLRQKKSSVTSFSKNTVEEHLAELDRQVENLTKECERLRDELRSREDLKLRIAAVEASQAVAKEQRSQLVQLMQTEATKLQQIQKITNDVYKQLRTAMAEHYRLLNSIQVVKPWYPQGLNPNDPTYDPDSLNRR